ncbi:hypothetical protein K525DRAFT_234073, partial [Schizophyllum commune Loenen D]
MKFGKHIQAQQVPGWSQYYLDYKFLKKIISSLADRRPASDSAALALGVRPADLVDADAISALSQASQEPPIFTDTDATRGDDVQAHKAAFFFKLERELEKINLFYLQKEAELRLRLETLLSKRRAAVLRGVPSSPDDVAQKNVEWSAVEEGFRLLERDLGKLQVDMLAHPRATHPPTYPLAIYRDQRHRLSQDPQEVRQAVEELDEGIVSRASG